jgi:CRISPR-associated protein Csd2
MDIINDSAKRHEFVLLFDVKNGNPNGDPDAGNLPRIDPESGHGIVTDVSIKRKIRDYLALAEGAPIFIQSSASLNSLKTAAAETLEEKLTKEEREGKKPIPRLRSKLCDAYYDIRMFGAVLSTGDKGDRLNAGQVRGPVQITFGQSIDPVRPLAAAITRQARTTEERMQTGTTEIGRKTYVPYGLYRAHGFFNPFLAEQTGVSSEDLSSFWRALKNLYEYDRSASRGEMSVVGLYVFTHENKLGNAPAKSLFNLVKVNRKNDPPRSSDDYDINPPKPGPLTDNGFDGVTFSDLTEG